MLALRITLIAVVALLVAACGAALAGSDDVGSSLTGLDPKESTTTVADFEVEDPPLPTAPPTMTSPNTTDGDAATTDGIADDGGPMLGDTDVSVYFLVEPDRGIDGTDIGCGLASAVTRRVQSPELLSGALEALLAGPTESEIAAGYGTVLTAEVDWELASVTIIDGTALIDLAEDSEPFNNMSASCVNLALMAQLEMTATQFPTVDRAVFSVGGDIATFYHWLERSAPEL